MSRTFYYLAPLLLLAPSLSLAWNTNNTLALILAQVVGDPQCASNETAFHALNETHIDVSEQSRVTFTGNTRPRHAAPVSWYSYAEGCACVADPLGGVGARRRFPEPDMARRAQHHLLRNPERAEQHPHPKTSSGAATEQLRTYLGASSSPANPSQSVYFMQFFLQPLPAGLGGVAFGNVQDLLLAVKDGNGTKLTWETSGCSNTSTAAATWFSQLHQHNLNQTVIIFNGGQPTSAT